MRWGLAAEKDVLHGGMMAVTTDSYLEIDVRALFGAYFRTHVDLEAARAAAGIDARPERVDRA